MPTPLPSALGRVVASCAIARDLLAKEILIAVERVDEVVADKRVDAHGEFSREDPERQDLVAWQANGERLEGESEVPCLRFSRRGNSLKRLVFQSPI